VKVAVLLVPVLLPKSFSSSQFCKKDAVLASFLLLIVACFIVSYWF